MAVLLVVAVRDRAANAFNRPFYVPAIGLAVRSFSDEINRAANDNPMFNHPDDYDLYQLGEFDEDEGTFECHTPRQICIGKNVQVPK